VGQDLCEFLATVLSATPMHITGHLPKTARGGAGQCANALRNAGPGNEPDIDYINAHGTSTYGRNVIELGAVERMPGRCC